MRPGPKVKLSHSARAPEPVPSIGGGQAQLCKLDSKARRWAVWISNARGVSSNPVLVVELLRELLTGGKLHTVGEKRLMKYVLGSGGKKAK